MRLGISPVLLLTLTASVSSAWAQSIDITTDLAGTLHQGEILPGTQATLYIVARPAGPIADGFTAAEFWVNGMPANWARAAIPNPACSAALGNPFATSPPFRANIGFPMCMRRDAKGVVLLYSVYLVAEGLVTDGCLIAQVAVPPTNPRYTTPILSTECNPPEDTFVAAIGTPFIMNPVTGQCTVGVNAATWGGIKHLYSE